VGIFIRCEGTGRNQIGGGERKQNLFDIQNIEEGMQTLCIKLSIQFQLLLTVFSLIKYLV